MKQWMKTYGFFAASLLLLLLAVLTLIQNHRLKSRLEDADREARTAVLCHLENIRNYVQNNGYDIDREDRLEESRNAFGRFSSKADVTMMDSALFAYQEALNRYLNETDSQKKEEEKQEVLRLGKGLEELTVWAAETLELNWSGTGPLDRAKFYEIYDPDSDYIRELNERVQLLIGQNPG